MKKKLLFVALMITGVLAVAGCKKNENTSEPVSEVTQEYDIVSMNMDDYMVLGEYKNLEIPYNKLEVTEESIIEQKELMINAKADKIGIKEGECKEGDIINFDFEGKLDGVAFEGGTAKGKKCVVGSGGYIAGFEDALIGMHPGETKDAPLTFPEEYSNKDLAGKDVIFTLTLNYFYPSVDDLTDEMVAAMDDKDFGSTVEEFDAFALKVLKQQAEDANRTNILGLAFEKIVGGCTFNEIPEVIYNNQRTELEIRYADALAGGAYSLDTVTEYLYECSADELITLYSKQRMAIQAIAKKEGITASDEEVEARLNELADAYGMTPENYLTVYMTTRPKLREHLISEKVQDFIYDNVKVVPNK